MALVFLAGPLSGLIVQPLIGLLNQSPFRHITQNWLIVVQVSWLITASRALDEEGRSSQRV